MPRKKQQKTTGPVICNCEMASRLADNEIRLSYCTCNKPLGKKPWRIIIKPEEYFEA